MATTEERMKILKMIEEGKISASEGARLLAALSAPKKKTIPGFTPKPASNAKWLRIKVTDTTSGRSKASVQIPINLIEAGMKIGAHFSAKIDGVDMETITRSINEGMTGKVVDVIDEEAGEHVEIYIE
ncbi:MAG TPA: hypothetical protein VN226_02430 [Anaerolineales bacterium]|nr:hypothetical protein [Anaerolineales bacterium]